MFDYLLQFFFGSLVTLKIATCSALIGILIGLLGATLESTHTKLRYFITGFLFIIRALPELLVLFFIYFGVTAILTHLFNRYIDINPFIASVTALSLIFGAYASQVFRGAFLAIPRGQLDAGRALGLNELQIFMHVQLPQAWRHAIPGLGNLWLVLLKDTAIVMLIGLTDLMGQAKFAASTTHQPFTYYLLAAVFYLLITTISQKIIRIFCVRANQHIAVST